MLFENHLSQVYARVPALSMFEQEPYAHKNILAEDCRHKVQVFVVLVGQVRASRTVHILVGPLKEEDKEASLKYLCFVVILSA